MMKKIISIFLILTMIFAMCVALIPASAAEAAATFDPSKVGNNVVTNDNRAQYVASLPAGAIAVGSKSDLKGKMQSGKYYYLTNNVTFSSGEYASAVSGTSVLENVTIDGCGYTITLNNAALFDSVKNLTVKNLTFDGTITANNNSQYHVISKTTDSKGYLNIENVTASVDFAITNKTDSRTVGALSDCVNNSTVKNVLNEGNVTVKNGTTKIKAIGGMFGTAHTTKFINVVNKGALTVEKFTVSTSVAIGGIVGYSEKSDYTNCVNSGAIKTAMNGKEIYLGGIVGYTGTKSVLDGCTNSGALTISAGGTVTSLGGIMAMVSGEGVEIYNSNNNGTISMSAASGSNAAAATSEPSNSPGMGIGGILGISRAKNIIIKNCNNTKNISIIASGTVAAGGIMGYQYCTAAIAESLNIEKCSNSGSITDSGSGAMLGGIVGSVRGILSAVVQDSTNTGSVTVSGTTLAWRSAGGICGMYGSVGGKMTGGDRNLAIAFDIYCCTNKGVITNTGAAGGMLGHNEEMAADKLVMTFYGCVNEGKITSSGSNAAGIYGYPLSKGYIVVNLCENRADVSGVDAGGIISTPSVSFEGISIKNAKNSGNITGAQNAGGIATKGNQEITTAIFENCLNTGKVHANSVMHGLSGGIVSYSKTAITIKNCVNMGNITSVVEGFAHPISHSQTVVTEDSTGNVYLKGTADASFIGHGEAKTSEQVSSIAEGMNFSCNNNPYNLTKAFEQANQFYPQDHTPESWQLLGEALARAEQLLADPNAAQADMDETVEDIKLGLKLIIRTGERDFSKLEQAIIDGEEEGKNWYTLTWLELFKAIRDAKLILNLEEEEKEKLLQSDIDKATNRIYQAIRDLIEKPPIQGEIDVEANGDFTVGTLRPQATTVTTPQNTTSTSGDDGEILEEEEEEEYSDPLIDMSGTIDLNLNCQGLIGGGAIALTAVVAIATGFALKKKED